MQLWNEPMMVSLTRDWKVAATVVLNFFFSKLKHKEREREQQLFARTVDFTLFSTFHESVDQWGTALHNSTVLNLYLKLHCKALKVETTSMTSQY